MLYEKSGVTRTIQLSRHKGKLPLFRDNGEQVIPIYGGGGGQSIQLFLILSDGFFKTFPRYDIKFRSGLGIHYNSGNTYYHSIYTHKCHQKMCGTILFSPSIFGLSIKYGQFLTI